MINYEFEKLLGKIELEIDYYSELYYNKLAKFLFFDAPIPLLILLYIYYYYFFGAISDYFI